MEAQVGTRGPPGVTIFGDQGLKTGFQDAKASLKRKAGFPEMPRKL
jgi:hypothetical protein